MAPAPDAAMTLGLRANAAQFALLVIVNAFVGAMVGEFVVDGFVGSGACAAGCGLQAAARILKLATKITTPVL